MNPFRYGSIVTGEYFFNRVDDIQRIKTHLLNGNHLIIYAPRRYGKTSLIMRVLKNLEDENINTVYLDFFNVFSIEKFLELYTLKILSKKKHSFETAVKKIGNLVKGISPTVSFDESGNAQFQLTLNRNVSPEKTFEDVINLPESGFNEKKWIVIFDEFQEINHLNGDDFEKQLRANIQFHKNVCYVFMGSKTHLLLNMFRDKSRAFYNIGKIMKVDKIPEAETIGFITERFQKSNLHITNDLVKYIIEVSDNIPYYCQFVAAEVWQNMITVKEAVEKEDVDFAVKRIIDEQFDYYLELFDKLSAYQKKLLAALTKSGEQIFSKEFAQQHSLSTTSSTQRAAKRLIDMGIVEKDGNTYSYSDPFFRRFVTLRLAA